MELPWLDKITRARIHRRLPVVLDRREVEAVLDQLAGPYRLIGMLLYGSGLRLLEACRLRTKDLDFERRILTVRQGKGGKDRVTVLPERLVDPLRDHLRSAWKLHRQDLREGAGWVELPDSLGESIPMRDGSGPGNGCFPQRAAIAIVNQGNCAAITCTRALSKGRSGWPFCALESPSAPAATPSATASRHTCWRTAPTFALFRSSWVTRV